MNASGIARTELEIVDLSILIGTGLKGITAFLGITEWGEAGKSKLVGSWPEYQREFGGLLASTDFPLICKRALEAGAKLKISPARHYTDATDSDTLVGEKASVQHGGSTNYVEFEFFSEGTGGNKFTVVATAAANGVANEFDISITVSGMSFLNTIVYKNLPKSPSTDDIAAFNGRSKFIKIIAKGGTGIAAGSATLAGGTHDNSTVVAADYVGDASAQTGLHAFDQDMLATKIAVPEMANATIDTAIAAYVEARKDMLGVVRTPFGLDGDGVASWRSTGAIDTWRMLAFTGGLRVTHPTSGLEVELAELGDVAGCMGVKDNKAKEWFSFGGQKRGRIRNALGVIYNFGAPALATQADLVDSRGVNMVLEHPSFGTVIWGNSTMQKAPTLLSHANVAELMIYLTRALKPITDAELFDPNDVDTWKAVWRNTVRVMEYVKTNRGVWDYKYDGDQLIDDVSQATVNTGDNIDAGQYIYNLFIKPKVGMKYAGIKVIVSNSGVSFDLLADAA